MAENGAADAADAEKTVVSASADNTLEALDRIRSISV